MKHTEEKINQVFTDEMFVGKYRSVIKDYENCKTVEEKCDVLFVGLTLIVYYFVTRMEREITITLEKE